MVAEQPLIVSNELVRRGEYRDVARADVLVRERGEQGVHQQPIVLLAGRRVDGGGTLTVPDDLNVASSVDRGHAEVIEGVVSDEAGGGREDLAGVAIVRAKDLAGHADTGVAQGVAARMERLLPVADQGEPVRSITTGELVA